MIMALATELLMVPVQPTQTHAKSGQRRHSVSVTSIEKPSSVHIVGLPTPGNSSSRRKTNQRRGSATLSKTIMVDNSSRQRTFDLLTSFYNNNLPQIEIEQNHLERQVVQQQSEEQNETLQLSGIEENGQPSGWRKVRNMVQWTPFIQEFKNRKYQWVQLAGHSGNFKAGRSQGTVLKKLCPQEEHCYNQFSQDSIAPYVPEYQGTICLDNDEKFIQLQDCLSTFVKPSIMDCKIGVRTYLEEELAKAKEKPKLRKDMFDKMIAVDPLAPTEEERRMKGVTKPRYMVWRETISSTATLGFRIEGVKKNDGTSSKEFKTTKTRDQVIDAFSDFISSSVIIARQYLERLQCIKKALSSSNFFSSHELIGSSLLFVHDSSKACVWLIDFGKTVPLPDGTSIDHKTPWVVGNHEDGYLIGVDNLISIFTQLVTKLES